jgi:hypothetical protein
MTIIEATQDQHLFAPLFRDPATWQAWVVWLKAVFALPMTTEEVELYKRCTGRTIPPDQESTEVYTVCGRRSGKSFIASLTAVYLACFRDYMPYLSPGERAVVWLLARDRSQAGVVFRYISGLFRVSPLLEQMIEKEGAEVLDLVNRVSILVGTSSYRSVRGFTVAAALCDEIAFWQVEGINPDREVIGALRPATATIPGAKLFCLSSPYARGGILYEAHKAYFGKDHAPVLVWQAPTSVMNPTIPSTLIANEMERDPVAARAEWGAEFREDIEAAFPLEIIDVCVIPGRHELPPAVGVSYLAFVDPSGGRADSFTLAIGHRKDNSLVVIDLLKEWRAPFSPEAVVRECCQWLSTYRAHRVTGDHTVASGPWNSLKITGFCMKSVASRKANCISPLFR